MTSISRRRRFGVVLVSAFALVASVLGLGAPAQAVVTRTVTVHLAPAQPGWFVTISCTTPDFSDYRTTGADATVVFHVADGSQCQLSAAPTSFYFDSFYTLLSGGAYNSVSSVSLGTVSSDVSRTLSLTENTSFRCAAPSTIAGTPAVGQPVTAVPGAFANGTATALRYDWFRVRIADGHVTAESLQTSAGATNSATYTPTEADLGWQLVALVSATSASSTALCDWRPSGVVGRLGTPSAGAPQVTGKAKVGKTLAAAVPALPIGTTATYQWFRVTKKKGKAVFTAIAGATGTGYKVRRADKGKGLAVAVTYSRTSYAPTTVLSGVKKVR